MWLWLALAAPLFFAVTGFIDKYLLTKVTAHLSAGAVMVISGIAALPLVLGVGIFAWHDITNVTFAQALLAFFSGVLVVWSYYYYYRALEEADASLVFAVYELTVVFTYVGARIFLGEVLSSWQVVAMFLIAGGSLGLTFQHRRGKWRIRRGLFWLLLVSTVIYSASDIVFKSAALDTGFLATQFYNYAAYGLVSLGLLFHPTIRRNFHQTMRQHRRLAWTLAGLNESLYLVGLILANYALVLAPIALVEAVVSIESLYMVVLGIGLTYFFPKILKEDVSRDNLVFKLVAIAVILTGMGLLAL